MSLFVGESYRIDLYLYYCKFAIEINGNGHSYILDNRQKKLY